MSIHKSKQKTATPGFTLVEVLVVISIFVLVLLGISSLYLTQGRIISSETKALSSQTEVLITLHTIIAPELQSASGIMPSYTFEEVDYFTDSQTIIFKNPSLNHDYEIIDGHEDVLIITMFGNSLVLLTDADPSSRRTSGQRPLFETLDSVLFEYSDENPSESEYVDVELIKDNMQTSYKLYLRNRP